MIPEENADTDEWAPSIGGLSTSMQADPSYLTAVAPQTRRAWFGRLRRVIADLHTKTSQYTSSLRSPSSLLSETDRQGRALQVVARLRQPFGAVLLTPYLNNAYRRVVAESLVVAQVVEMTPAVLNQLIEGVRTLDVL